MSLLITDATVLDGVAYQPHERQCIWIEAGRIKAVGRREQLSIPSSAQILDARGKYVTPGLMDANVHLFGDIRMEHLVRHEGRYEAIIAESAQIALKNGVTTVFDTWGPRAALIRVRDDINTGKQRGSRIYCAGNIVGLDGPFSADFIPKTQEVASAGLVRRINSLFVENVGPDLSWMTPEQVAAEVRAYLALGIDFIKYASSEHRGAEPNAFLLFSPLVQKHIVEEAHRAGTTAQAHTTSVEGLRVAVEAGSDIIQHCNLTGPVPIPSSTLELLARNRTGAVIFPLTQRRLEIFKERFDGIGRRYWSTVNTNSTALIESGALLLLGTDGAIQAAEPASGASVAVKASAAEEDDLMRLGEGHFNWFKAMEEMGCPAMRMLQAATHNIAVAYGKDRDLGSVEVGKIADLLILDSNPLESAKNYRSIRTVIKDGNIVDTDKLPESPVFTKPVSASTAEESYGRFSPSRFPCCGAF